MQIPATSRADTIVEVMGQSQADRLDVVQLEPGVHIAHFALRFDESTVPEPVTLSVRHPLGDIYAHWTADFDAPRFFDRSVQPPWESFRTSATRGAPVSCSYSQAGVNRITYAWSDARNPLTIAVVPDETRGELVYKLTLFDLPTPPFSSYDAWLRIDTRGVPYHDALDAVRAWWAAMPEYEPAPIPNLAREPMYSTWYSHQVQITAEVVEDECRRAKELGLNAVIVDDGWQTESVDWGYDACGDWIPAPGKFPDMRAHVERVHALGMKYLLWFSVPFLGSRSQAWATYRQRLLAREPILSNGQWGVLDPRFPDVREMLISTYERACEWGIDGLKLDFIDEFQLSADDGFGGERDTDSVVEAVDRLLTDATDRLRSFNPQVGIEFRQTYSGPLMRHFGNMLRASDCPADALENRVRTLSLRLLAGSTPVHSDPLVWDAGARAEVAAAHLINVLFAVPQISVRLAELAPEHEEAIRFWLGFWRDHRDALLQSRLRPLQPELNFPLVIAEGRDETVAALYGQEVLTLDALPPTLYVVNGTAANRVIVDLPANPVTSVVRDCCGRVLSEERMNVNGVTALSVPASGLVELHRLPRHLAYSWWSRRGGSSTVQDP